MWNIVHISFNLNSRPVFNWHAFEKQQFNDILTMHSIFMLSQLVKDLIQSVWVLSRTVLSLLCSWASPGSSWRDSPCNQCSVLCSMTNKLYVLFYEMLIALSNWNANNFVIMLHFALNLNLSNKLEWIMNTVMAKGHC